MGKDTKTLVIYQGGAGNGQVFLCQTEWKLKLSLATVTRLLSCLYSNFRPGSTYMRVLTGPLFQLLCLNIFKALTLSSLCCWRVSRETFKGRSSESTCRQQKFSEQYKHQRKTKPTNRPKKPHFQTPTLFPSSPNNLQILTTPLTKFRYLGIISWKSSVMNTRRTYS